MEACAPRYLSTVILAQLAVVLEAVAASLRTACARLAARKRAAENFALLVGMSERELRNLGICRASVRVTASGIWTTLGPR